MIATRARGGVDWPDPNDIAGRLGLTVRVLELDGIKYGTSGSAIVVGSHDDPRVVCHRLASAIAQHLLSLSAARWTTEDAYVLAFELLMPADAIRRTPPDDLRRCQPRVHPNLLSTWAEYVRETA